MQSQRYHTRLTPVVAEQVAELAWSTGASISSTIRRCVEIVLSSPELVLMVHTVALPQVPPGATPEQERAWQRYVEEGQGVDVAQVLAEQPPPVGH
jgi:hypothetical protein